MRIATLSTLSLFYLSSAVAKILPRGFTPPAKCSNGRTASSQTCCVWYDVLDDLQANLFEGQCGDDAHDALRLSFHDAIGYSPKLGGGGADGSLIMFANTELSYGANDGLDSIVAAEQALADKHGVSYGDFIQFAGAVSVRNCPGGPRIPFYAGRPNATAPAPDGLVPEPFDSVDKILARVVDAGLTPEELIDLLASHSIGVQEDVDPTIPNTPFDTTPNVFDTNFFLETLLHGVVWPGDGLHLGEVLSPFLGEFRLQSDYALARDPRTACYWQSFINQQSLMSSRFRAAMAKMALLGQNLRSLTDCSEVVPAPTLPTPPPARLPHGLSVLNLDTTCRAGPWSQIPAISSPKLPSFASIIESLLNL